MSFGTVRIPLTFIRLRPLIPAAATSRQITSLFHCQERRNHAGLSFKSFCSHHRPSIIYSNPLPHVPRSAPKKSFTSHAAAPLQEEEDEKEEEEGVKDKADGQKDKEYRIAKQTESSVHSRVSEAIPLGAIVRVFCTHSEPFDESAPWSGTIVYSSSSSGLIVTLGRKVITNAHCVEHHALVKLQKHGSYKKYTATVLAVATECDCALLTVHDEEFWEGVPPVEFSDALKRSDAINVVGFPSGRDTTSTTRGVITCLEMVEYLQSSMTLPAFQIDASVNPGNSGGPVFDDDGKCVGLAFQGLTRMKRNDVIPASVILHLTRDYEKNEVYTGFPDLGVKWQGMKDPVLRQTMGMASDQTGVLITSVEPTSPECQVLKESDVLLSFDGVKIGNDGTVSVHEEPMNYSYIVSQKYCGDTVRVEVLRDSRVLEFDIQLANHKRRILSSIKNRPVSYYTIAGLVFTTVSDSYLCAQFGHEYELKSPIGMLEKLRQTTESADSEPIILSQILPADINQGYGDGFENLEVLAVNGMAVKNLRSIVELVENCHEEFLKFEFSNKKKIVLRTEDAKSSNPDILRRYGIHFERSSNLYTESKT